MLLINAISGKTRWKTSQRSVKISLIEHTLPEEKGIADCLIAPSRFANRKIAAIVCFPFVQPDPMNSVFGRSSGRTKAYIVTGRNILFPIIVVTEKLHERREIYICSTCGLGYDDILIAYACEQYHRQYRESSTDIVKRAIYRPPALEKARKQLTN